MIPGSFALSRTHLLNNIKQTGTNQDPPTDSDPDRLIIRSESLPVFPSQEPPAAHVPATPPAVSATFRPHKSNVSLRTSILSGVVQVVREKESIKREHMLVARQRQQEIALLQNINTPPADEPDDRVPSDSSFAAESSSPSIQQKIDRLQLELANLRGEKIEYLSHAQLDQLHETLRKSLDLVTERQKKLKARKKEAFKACIICMEEHRNTVFQCGHLVTCSTCAEMVTDCPVCRADITTRINVHGELFQ